MQPVRGSQRPRHAQDDRWSIDRAPGTGMHAASPVTAQADPAVAQVPSWRLGDHVYLIAHDGFTGQARLGERVMGVLLAGGLLAELVLDEAIGVHNGWLSRRPEQQPRDAVAHTILAEILADPDVHEVAQWLEFLGAAAPVTATDRIAERLVRDGILHEVSERRWFRTETSLQAVNSSRAAWPAARLDGLARRRAQLTKPDAVLVGLLDAAGLLPVALAGVDHDGLRYLRSRAQYLPPSEANLVEQVRAAIGAAVLTGRT